MNKCFNINLFSIVSYMVAADLDHSLIVLNNAGHQLSLDNRNQFSLRTKYSDDPFSLHILHTWNNGEI